ncbi:hypothetical protein OV320_8028 [Actinobacteria bacterium OV320]|nr:hypothetical protein OV320_8028 [Actinobacteria bacterium OV320]
MDTRRPAPLCFGLFSPKPGSTRFRAHRGPRTGGRDWPGACERTRHSVEVGFWRQLVSRLATRGRPGGGEGPRPGPPSSVSVCFPRSLVRPVSVRHRGRLPCCRQVPLCGNELPAWCPCVSSRFPGNKPAASHMNVAREVCATGRRGNLDMRLHVSIGRSGILPARRSQAETAHPVSFESGSIMPPVCSLWEASVAGPRWCASRLSAGGVGGLYSRGHYRRTVSYCVR